MDKLGVLVVDDSAVLRKQFTRIIHMSPLFQVIGIARNGVDAIEKIERLKPALVVMDIDMPVMDGLSALKLLMKQHPIPVIMTGEGENDTSKHLCKQHGAAGFIVKTELLKPDNEAYIQSFHDLLQRASVNRLQPVTTHIHTTSAAIQLEGAPTPKRKKLNPSQRQSNGLRADLIVIGCSTGGPSALQAILPFFPKDFAAPVLVIQHMPPGFTKPLAERLNNSCALTVKEAEDKEKLEAGYIYVAPAGYQTTIQQVERARIFAVSPSTGDHLYKPSIDVTLQSLAPIYKERLVVSILTGMGVDGTKGCKEVKRHDGHVLAEAQSTCVVYGMPKSVFESGYTDEVTELHSMYKAIMKYAYA